MPKFEWVKKIVDSMAFKNLEIFRSKLGYELEDLRQEGALVFIKISKRYGQLPRDEFVSVFRISFRNHLNTMIKNLNRSPIVFFEGYGKLAMNSIEDEMTTMFVILEEAPNEVCDLLKILLTAPREILDIFKSRNAVGNVALNKLVGAYHYKFNFKKIFKELLNFA